MKILCFSLSLSEHTLLSIASIPNNFFVKAGGMDFSFLIIMLSMFLVIEKIDAQFRKKEETLRTLLPYALLYTMPCLHNQKSQKKSSPHICYLSHTVDISFLTQHNSLPDSIVSHYYL